MYDLNKREKPRPAEVFSSRAAFFTVNRIMAKTLGKRHPIAVRRSLPDCEGIELKVSPEYTS